MTVEDPRATYTDLLEQEVIETFTPAEFDAMCENEAYSTGWVTVGVVLDDDDRVLLAQGEDDVWRAPGGTLQHGESLHQTLRREVREETGVEADPVRPHAVVDVVGTHRDRDESLSFSSFEADLPTSWSEGFRLVGRAKRVGRGGSRHSRHNPRKSNFPAPNY